MTASYASPTAHRPRRGAAWLRLLTGPARLARRRLRAGLRRGLAYWPDVAAFSGALLCAGLAAVLAGLLGGCGGGVGSEGTGSFASGTITGYGSIIVNGVHFDERTAQVQDDDGQTLAPGALALGMVVQVSAGPVATAADGTRQAVADSVRTQRALVGPVSALDLAGSRLTLLGQTVRLGADTVVDERLGGGLAGLAAGQWLEVYGFYDAAAGAFAATRLAPSGPSAGLRISGPVAAVDAGSRTLRLGSQSYSLVGVASVPAPDALVSLKLQADTDAQGRWVVSGQQAGAAPPQDRDGARLDGRVSQLLPAGRFIVDGVTVDSSAARVSGSLAVGAQVEVSGALRAGVLVASEVQARSEQARSFELNGSPSGLDAVRKRFVLRGTTVSYARADVVFDGGNAASLVGYSGELKVEGQLSADRTLVEATRIRFKGR